MLTTVSTVAEALFKHTNKSISFCDKANRTTVLGSGTGQDALSAKGDITALVQKMPGEYENDEDAKKVRSKIVRSVGGFLKPAVQKAARKISDTLHDTTFAPLGKLHSNNLKSIEHIKSVLIALQTSIDEMAGAMTGATRKACIPRFDSQTKGVIGKYEKVNKLNEIAKGPDAQASAYTSVDNSENVELEYDKLELIQRGRDSTDKEIARATTAIVSAQITQAIITLGSSGRDGRYARLKPMFTPVPRRGKGADLQDMIMAYLLGNGTAMTTFVPAVIRLQLVYNPDNGMW